MNRKLLALFIGFILIALTVASDAFAQNYPIQNASPVPVTIIIQGTCPGPPPSTWTVGPVVIPPGGVIVVPIPPPPCGVTGVILNGTFYSVGYSGPVVPPNPPTRITVTPLRTIIQ